MLCSSIVLICGVDSNLYSKISSGYIKNKVVETALNFFTIGEEHSPIRLVLNYYGV